LCLADGAGFGPRGRVGRQTPKSHLVWKYPGAVRRYAQVEGSLEGMGGTWGGGLGGSGGSGVLLGWHGAGRDGVG
jgi:hypothetical protein